MDQNINPPLRLYPTGLIRLIIVGTAISAAFLQLVDSTIVNVALRQMAGSLGTSTIDIAWVITAYAISNVIIIPLSGMLANIFGRKLYFTFSIGLFTFASAMCGASHSLLEIGVWRFLQGIGGGALMATSQTIVMEAFPPKKIGMAMAIYGMALTVGPTVGPFLGGYLTDNFSWHWIFLVNIPIGLLATVLSWRFIENSYHETRVANLDWWGIGWLIIAVGSIQFVLEEGNRYDWFDSRLITTLSIAAVISAILFIRRELKTPHPAVDLSLFVNNRNLTIGIILTFVLGAVLVGAIYVYPLFTQIELGWTAQLSGISIMPGVLLTGVAIGLSQRYTEKGNCAKYFIVTGFLLTALFCFWMSVQSPDSNWNSIFIPMLIRGFAFGLIMAPVLALSVEGLSGYKLAQGNGIINMARQLGAAVGVALLNVRITHSSASMRSDLISNITSTDPATAQGISTMTSMFSSNGFSLDQAQAAVYKLIDVSVIKQTVLLSYLDAFQMVGITCVIVIPLVFFMKPRLVKE